MTETEEKTEPPADRTASPLTGACLRVCRRLPPRLRAAVEREAALIPDFCERLSEIRVRADRLASLVLDGHNLPLSVVVPAAEVEALLRRCCDGSVYAYTESLREGYLFVDGCRVGVAGRAVTRDGAVLGVDLVSSLVFRLPHSVPGAADAALEAFERLEGAQGMLVYSAPGVGKTTLLRDLILRLSCGPRARRVAVVDCREELGAQALGRGCMVDFLVGYPKAEGIEIATRTLSPEVVVCDEIGSFDEAESILGTQSCGVPLIASAHADSFGALMRRGPVRLLCECGVFGAFVGITRRRDRRRYTVDWAPPPSGDALSFAGEAARLKKRGIS